MTTSNYPRLAGDSGPKDPRELSVEEMREVIRGLRPKNELHTGINFLERLLDQQGVDGVIVFVEQAYGILGREGKLLEYDFSPMQKELLKKSKPDTFSRRTFLRTTAWAAPGAVFAVAGIAKTGEQIEGYVKGKDEMPGDSPTNRRSFFTHVSRAVDRHLIGPADLVIGAALINEGIEKWQEIKLDQVANAVAECAETLKLEAAPASGR